MRPLPAAMTVPLGDGELVTSFVSRTAMHLGRTPFTFCRDMGFSFSDVVDGKDEAIQKVAQLCRANLEHLRRNAIVLAEPWFSLMGQVLGAAALERGQLRVCPRCLIEDLENHPGEPQVRPYGRSLWRVASIRTCIRHHSPLVNVSARSDRNKLHDFAFVVSRSVPDLGDLAAHTTTRRPSAFELYLVHRLQGDGQRSSWLDQFPFYAAAKACEVMGAVADYGLKVRFSQLSEDDWYRAGMTGFLIASEGESGVRDFLATLQKRFFDSKNTWGAGQMFGRLYHWLAHETDDPAYEPLRSLIHDIVIETIPVGPGDEIFGRRITKRRIHSLRSASREYGVPPKRLRTLLHQAGYIGDDAQTLTSDRTLFDASETRQFLAAAAESMNLKDAKRYLNTPRRHERMLIESGFIHPLVGRDGRALPNLPITKRELDRFLTRLLKGAQPGDPSSEELFQIPVAAKRASCPPGKVVELIMDGQLRAYRSSAERGYLSVLVNLADLRELLIVPGGELLSLRKAQRMLGVHHTTMNALVAHEFLRTCSVVNRNNGKRHAAVAAADAQTFMSRYVSLHALARERGVGLMRLKKVLAAAGVMPALDPTKTSTAFYERAAVCSVET